MKRKNILCVFAVVLAATVLLSNCDNFGTIRGVIGFRGEVYFQNAENIGSKSVARSAIDLTDIEFLVLSLVLKDDTQEGGVWVVGGNEGGRIGWYDINGLQRAFFGNQPQGRTHSCVQFRVRAIRINDKIYWSGWTGMGMPSYNGTKASISTNLHEGGGGFGILAGDVTKFGPGEGLDPQSKQLPFPGVSNRQTIASFIVGIDTDKLLKADGTLADTWWECFSFVVR